MTCIFSLLAPFARASWVAHAWFIEYEILSNNYASIAEIINAKETNMVQL